MSFSTVALTTALSKLSETSRIDRINTIHSSPSVPTSVPVLAKPYHTASPKQTRVKTSENL